LQTFDLDYTLLWVGRVGKLLGEIRVNGIKLCTINHHIRTGSVASVGDTHGCLSYEFETGHGTHWEGFSIVMSYGPTPPPTRREIDGEEYYFRRAPSDFTDDEIEEVTFKFFSVYIAEEGNDDDVLLRPPS